MVDGIWEQFLNIIKDQEGSRVVETWFKAVSLYRWDEQEKTVYLQTPNSFVKEWIQTKFMDLTQLHLGRLLHVEMPKVVFIDRIAEQSATQEPKKEVAQSLSMVELAPKENARESKSAATKLSVFKRQATHRMSHNYTFDSFVVGPSNSLAYAAAYAVTEKPGHVYNPLFFYGASGLGKTHLLHAIAHQIKVNNPRAKVVYQTADYFVTEFISAIRFDKIHKFQEKYKAIDVLLIDDIQFISNKEQTQEAFFHIFNMLYEANKQLVFSSDLFPENIQGIAERLRSRLGWGLVADLHKPTLEVKIAIVKKKVALSGEEIDDGVAHCIASHVTSNVRELEGALIRVLAFSSLTKQEVTVELVEKVLGQTEKRALQSVDFARIVSGVARHYPYTLNDLRSKNRNKEVVLVRQITMFLMKQLTERSLRDIGHYLGGRDHSTVMHAVDKVEKTMQINRDLHEKIRKIEQEINR